MMLSAEFLPLIAFTPVVLMAAWTDLRLMRIPNTLVMFGLMVFAATVFLPGWEEAMWRAVAGLCTFVVCFALFGFRIVGGGDAKFFPVMMLFIPTAYWAEFMIVFSLAMAFSMGLLLPVRKFVPLEATGWKSLTPDGRFPMGTAFATAVLLFLGFFAA